MAGKPKIFDNIDWITIGVYIALVFIGWLNIYSSAYVEDTQFSFGSRYGKQLIMIAVNLLFLIAVFFLEGHIIPTISYYLFAFLIILLIAVLFFGDVTGGSRSWFKIGSFKLQPAEFTKLAVALAMAKIFGNDNIRFPGSIKDLFIISSLIVFPAILIILQGDTGSALVFSAFIFVLYRQGLPFYWLLFIFIEILVFIAYFFIPQYVIFCILILLALVAYRVLTGNMKETVLSGLLIVGIITILLAVVVFLRWNSRPENVISIALLIFFIISVFYSLKKRQRLALIIPLVLVLFVGSVYTVNYTFNEIFEDHHRKRINVLFGIDKDLTDEAYNVHQSKIAIGSGGFSGKGYLKGTQTKYDFVPEQDTDFIFCTIGEEWGFIGTTSVIILFSVLLIRILQLSERQKSVYSRVFGWSLASVLFFHFAVNIAMTIGLAPVIGIPLPFISYGGSSLFAFSFFLFIFIRLDAERNTLFT
jgi:rod shape determining protein RodA